MKKTRISLAVAAASMISAPAFATNGDNLSGLGVQSRAMGGTGTAAFYGSENALTNPALLGKSDGSEFAIGGTLFMPDVTADTNAAAMPGMSASQKSEADTNIIPEVSMSTRIDDNLVFGLGMYGTAGMGVDYRDNDDYPDGTGLFNATSNLQLMKFVPTLSYNKDNYGFGIAPVIQYGALDLNYNNGSNVGNGVSTDLGNGFNLGGYFDVAKNLTVGVTYQSAINMTYDGQITDAADGFQVGPNAPMAAMKVITSDDLEQPAEVKVGVAYTMNNWMMTADAKQIQWGSAAGYEDFNWQDQNVYGLGAKYSVNNYWVGFGYNYGEDPIEVLPNVSTNPVKTYTNQAINMFNNHFFPAVVESHYTVGGGYSINKTMTLEGAIVYAAEVDKTIDTGAISDAFDNGVMDGSIPADGTSHNVKHSQIGYTISLRMNF